MLADWFKVRSKVCNAPVGADLPQADNVVIFSAWGTRPEDKKPSLRNVAKTLRVIADQIDAGEHGKVLRAALVLRCVDMEPQIFGMGDLPNAAQAYMDFHAAAQQLLFAKGASR